jgi:uncharacterized paraquat-inducible protein A
VSARRTAVLTSVNASSLLVTLSHASRAKQAALLTASSQSQLPKVSLNLQIWASARRTAPSTTLSASLPPSTWSKSPFPSKIYKQKDKDRWTDEENGEDHRKYCKICKDNKSNYYCVRCGVPLRIGTEGETKESCWKFFIQITLFDFFLSFLLIYTHIQSV